MPEFRIEWTIQGKGYTTNHGDWFDASKKQLLESSILYLNKKHDNIIHKLHGGKLEAEKMGEIVSEWEADGDNVLYDYTPNEV